MQGFAGPGRSTPEREACSEPGHLDTKRNPEQLDCCYCWPLLSKKKTKPCPALDTPRSEASTQQEKNLVKGGVVYWQTPTLQVAKQVPTALS